MNIEKFCENYGLDNVINTSKITGGLMHKMFKVETDKGIYCIKVLNPEVMSRETAYSNFITSEKISNLAKKNGIPVSSALNINGNYLTMFDNYYYMVFDYVDGKVLKDDEITIEHCIKIGNVLASIHSLNYRDIGLEPNIVEYKRLYDWESYVHNPNFSNMDYKQLYLDNYQKYNSLLQKANESFNNSNKTQTICHRDMDPRNVMWQNNNPVIIDWESASIANPDRELFEDALCWSGFLSNNFNEEKFTAVFNAYSRFKNIDNVDWHEVCIGNLVGRLGWLKYNLERSLGITSNDEEEMKLAENEVVKTIDEINRYLELSDRLCYTISKINNKKKEVNYMNEVNAKNIYTDRLELRIPSMEEQHRLWEILINEDVNKYYFPTPDKIFEKNNLSKDSAEDLKKAKEIFMVQLTDWEIQKPRYEKKVESIQSQLNDNKYTWSIFLKDTNTVIGQITCYPKNSEHGIVYDVGWFIDPKYQGLGYASEAAIAMMDFMFNEVGINEIMTSAAEINPGSWKIMEKLGFEYYGTKQSSFFKDGEILKSKKYHGTKEMFLNKINEMDNIKRTTK